MNAGIKTQGGLKYSFPGNYYLGHDGDYHNWPINKENGKDISYYDNNNFGSYKSYHVFGQYTDFFGAYWKDDDFGMAKYGDYGDKPGKKIWIWGLSGQGMIWEKLLTDNDDQYSEIQSGRLFNQTADKSSFTPFKHKGFEPYGSDSWQELWYPVLKTKGIVEASSYAALNLEKNNGWLNIYLSPVQTINDSLKIFNSGELVYTKLLRLSPLQTFHDSLKLQAESKNITISLGNNKLNFKLNPNANELGRPVAASVSFDWNSVYGLYVQGKEKMHEKNYAAAKDLLQACLMKDPNYVPALTEMASLLYHNIQPDSALLLIKKALSFDTYDPKTNFYYGIINAHLGNFVDAKDGFNIAALSLEYRSAAYTELSKLSLVDKDWQKAVDNAKKALDFNRFNITALEQMAIAYRQLHNDIKAVETLQLITAMNPLNHFAGFEKYLLKPSEENKKDFRSLIKNELAAESFIELAMTYYNAGLYDNAIDVLSLSEKNAMSLYWLAYLSNLLKKPFSATLQEATNTSPAFVFPFRSEDERMLHWAIGQNDSWKPKYYLALLLNDRGRKTESTALLSLCKTIPDFAPFYATRAAIANSKNSTETDLKKANSLDNKSWRYYKLLTEYYIREKRAPDALKTIAPYFSKHKENYIIGMLYAKTLLLNKKFVACIQVLNNIHILPFEGATTGRELYKEANLMLAIEEMKKKNLKKALSFLEDAKKWPENLGSGKPYAQDIDERLENWVGFLCQVKKENKKEAEKYLSYILNYKNELSSQGAVIEANHLITAWAIEKTESRAAAIKYLQALNKNNSDSKVLTWVISVFENNTPKTDLDTPEMRVISSLIKIE